jgi:hypothetical protein
MYRLGLVLAILIGIPAIIGAIALYQGMNASAQSHARTTPLYAAQPSGIYEMSARIHTQDIRLKRLETFFSAYNSPLLPYASLFISEADLHGFDYRLLPAIALQESGLCRRIILDSYNCWGWGIYTNKVTKFDSYEHAITTISRLFDRDYIEKGLETPDDIQKKYNPSNTNNWSEKIRITIESI